MSDLRKHQVPHADLKHYQELSMALIPVGPTRQAMTNLLGLAVNQKVLSIRPTGYLVEVETTNEHDSSIEWREVKIS